MFEESEINRYKRHLSLSQFGIENQIKLKTSKILIVGVGGLGSPALLYLAAAGIGKIGIIDFDVIEESNLNRQILYKNDDIGKSKSKIANNRINDLNPFINVVEYNVNCDYKKLKGIINDYDIILGCVDNYKTRSIINQLCIENDKINIFGSIKEYEGQISVFNYNNGPCYECLFGEEIDDEEIEDNNIGSLGLVGGIIGCMMANEVIKIITGIGEVKSGILQIYNSLNNGIQDYYFQKDLKCKICKK